MNNNKKIIIIICYLGFKCHQLLTEQAKKVNN